jgi:CheY-specific phosphatase CheX
MAKILVIDDNQGIVDEYERVLTGASHKVVKALDGQSGLQKCEKERFDLIITDIQMPKFSGTQFIEFLQRESGMVPVPIIIASGFIDATVQKQFGGKGRIGFLSKPISPKALTEKVTEMLNDKGNRKIDVRFINPIITATLEVIHQMTGFTVTVGKPFVKNPGEASGDISGVVGVISTGFKGSISLSFSEKGFLAVVSKMLGVEFTQIDDENKDAVTELLNIIFGKAKRTLNETGMDIQSAIPSIVRSSGHTLESHSKVGTIVIPFESPEIGTFRSEVSSSN